MKKITAIVLVRLVFISICMPFVAMAGTYSGGSGEPNTPYLIATPEDMNTLGATSDDWNKCFKLVADINMAEFTGTQYKIIGSGYEIPFTGTFDGDGHKIVNLTYTASTAVDYIGLFGCIGSGSRIKNLGIEDVNIIGGINSNCVGGLCGYNCEGSSITNCYSTGTVNGTGYVGGLCGSNYSSITNCYSTGTVSGTGYYVGGLCGENCWGSITKCYSTSNVSGYGAVSGLCGVNYSGSITNCYSTGTVSGTGYDVGGLCGRNSNGSVSNSYSTGNVSGGYSVGGLCGQNSSGSVSNSYSTGNVSGTECVGGLCGSNGGGSVSNSYSTGNVTGSNYVGGLCGNQYGLSAKIEKSYSTGMVSATGSYKGGFLGYLESRTLTACFWGTQTSSTTDGVGNINPDPNGVIGKTTADMQIQSTFIDAGWDFATPVWKICESTNYPKLAWQIPLAGDFGCPDGVEIYDLAFLSSQWLFEGDYAADISPVGGDGIVDFLDFAALAENWLLE